MMYHFTNVPPNKTISITLDRIYQQVTKNKFQEKNNEKTLI